MKKTNKNSLAETPTAYSASPTAATVNGAGASTRESVAVRVVASPQSVVFRPLPTGFGYPSKVVMSH